MCVCVCLTFPVSLTKTERETKTDIERERFFFNLTSLILSRLPSMMSIKVADGDSQGSSSR